jgi:predicted DNA-binding protein (UPF0251 family)
LEGGVALLEVFAGSVGVVLPSGSDVSAGERERSFRVARSAALTRLTALGYTAAQLSVARGHAVPGVLKRVKRTNVESRRSRLHLKVLREYLQDRPSPDLVERKLVGLQRFDDRPGPSPERTAARVEVIELMARRGLRRVDIAERMGLSSKSVWRLGERFGIEFVESGRKSAAYVIDEVLVRMLGGESVNDIARSVGRTSSSVLEALQIRGLKKPDVDANDGNELFFEP